MIRSLIRSHEVSPPSPPMWRNTLFSLPLVICIVLQNIDSYQSLSLSLPPLVYYLAPHFAPTVFLPLLAPSPSLFYLPSPYRHKSPISVFVFLVSRCPRQCLSLYATQANP